MVEEKRTSVNTRTPAYVNVLCKIRCSNIFCLRCVCNDDKSLALNKYFFLNVGLGLLIWDTIPHIYIYIYIYIYICNIYIRIV